MSTSSPFSFLRTIEGSIAPTSMFLGASDGADEGSATGAESSSSATACASSPEGSFAYPTDRAMRSVVLVVRKMGEKTMEGINTLSQNTRSTRNTDFFRLLVSLDVGILFPFLTLFQGPFSSGPSLGQLGSAVGGGRLARPLCGCLRPCLC